jgi:hypothetical protein
MIFPNSFKRLSAHAGLVAVHFWPFLTAAGFFDREETARAAEQKVFAL